MVGSMAFIENTIKLLKAVLRKRFLLRERRRAGDAEFILSCPDLTVDIKNSKELSEALIKVASLSKEKRKK